jgi:superfamily I DNA/RNA helicase
MPDKKWTKFPPKKPDNSHLYTPAVKHNWSEYQKNIFRNIAKENGHLIVEAYAGSAKTTSIVESFKYVPKGKKTLVLAFNKIIQEELRSRAPSYTEVFTFHSLGFRAIKQRFGTVELDDNKVFDLVKSQLGDDADFDLIINICETVAYCKYGLQDTPNQIDDIISKFGIDLCETDKKQFINLVIKTLGLDKANTAIIDFNDMCYFPFVYNLPLGQYDYVYVDEAQDLNKSQLVMAKKACKIDDGRIVMVLDPYQALYSWRMADTSILEDLKQQSATKILPLPISYRCPKLVIDLAQNWVPDITCPDTAIQGEVKDISLNDLYKLAKPGCFILSRTNAPMVKICMSLIRNNVRANIRGRDIGKQLNYLIKKSKKKEIPAFLKWLENWKNEEVEKLKAKNFNTENVLDRQECLINLCDECKTLKEVSKRIDDLFNDTDEKNIVILSTVHRAKGLEREDVFLLRWTFRAWFDKMFLLEKPNEECNIAYVAATRSKKRLFVVQKPIV